MSQRKTALRTAGVLCISALLGCGSTYYEDGDGPVVNSRGKIVDNVDGKHPGEVDLGYESNAEESEEGMFEDAVEDAER